MTSRWAVAKRNRQNNSSSQQGEFKRNLTHYHSRHYILQLVLSFFLGCCSTLAVLAVIHPDNAASGMTRFVGWLRRDSHTTLNGCLAFFGTFRGQEYRTKETVASKCLVESKFVKIQQHAVQLDASSPLITDWIWIDYHERINVLVQTGGNDVNDGSIEFTILEQTKYALDGQPSMALVGGIVEPGEQPRDAAQREVREEMNLDCKTFVFLGRFRTDVNRGMGWTNGFLAQQCTKVTAAAAAAAIHDGDVHDQVGGADTERQDMKTRDLPGLRRLVMDGQFMEIQWTAIASLALLHLTQADN